MRLGLGHPGASERSFGAFDLRLSDWDTNHFGRKMGVLAFTPSHSHLREDSLTEDLVKTLAEATREGYDHVILRVPAEQLVAARVAERSGLRLVDVAVDLATSSFGLQAPVPVGPGARHATSSDRAALRSIAEGAFEFSRFAADPFFSSDDVAGFYRQWITNLCDGLARAVLVVQAADEIAGFTSCMVQTDGTGRIPLIATSEEHRRQGVGRALVDASLRWFVGAGIRAVRVKTQIANYAALALYHRAGFTVAEAQLTFSATLRRGQPPVA